MLTFGKKQRVAILSKSLIFSSPFPCGDAKGDEGRDALQGERDKQKDLESNTLSSGKGASLQGRGMQKEEIEESDWPMHRKSAKERRRKIFAKQNLARHQ